MRTNHGEAIEAAKQNEQDERDPKAGRGVIKQIAANYGIPESVFEATSGFEIEPERTGLREVRRDPKRMGYCPRCLWDRVGCFHELSGCRRSTLNF